MKPEWPDPTLFPKERAPRLPDRPYWHYSIPWPFYSRLSKRWHRKRDDWYRARWDAMDAAFGYERDADGSRVYIGDTTA